MSTFKFLPNQLVLTLDLGRVLHQDQLVMMLDPEIIKAVILYDRVGSQERLQDRAAPLVSLIQSNNVAAIVAGEPRIAMRLKADGIHVEAALDQLKEAKTYSPNLIVGFGNPRDRHTAMEAGDLLPDYLFFGKLGADNKPEIHARNFSLAQWWAQLMEIPAVIQAGAALESLNQAVQSESEFIAIENVVFNSANPQTAWQNVRSYLNGLEHES